MRENEAETEVSDLIAVDGHPAGLAVAQSQIFTKRTDAKRLPKGSVTIESRAWLRPCCQTVDRQTGMTFIGIGTETASETVIETVTEIASETVIGIVIVTRIVHLAHAVTTRSTDMSANDAIAKRNVSALTAAVLSKKMSMI
jgi:hypothetical protein